jgi:hypothetical protein
MAAIRGLPTNLFACGELESHPYRLKKTTTYHIRNKWGVFQKIFGFEGFRVEKEAGKR